MDEGQIADPLDCNLTVFDGLKIDPPINKLCLADLDPPAVNFKGLIKFAFFDQAVARWNIVGERGRDLGPR